MRILFTIPHYFNPEGDARHGSGRAAPGARAAALDDCIAALHQNFGQAQGMIDIAGKKLQPANEGARHDVAIVVHALSAHHLFDRLEATASLYEQRTVREAEDPRMIGFACHETLRERLADYDYFCYLEDDLVLHDPWLFAKLRWFAGQVGDDSLLQPNRFEMDRGGGSRKVYVDGNLLPRVTAPFQSVSEDSRVEGRALGRKIAFERALNPHSGCFFLNAEQMERWAGEAHFLDRDTSFIGPLESAASLGIMRTFKVYKAARNCANFLEIEHRDNAFMSLLPGE